MKHYQTRYAGDVSFSEYKNILNILYLFERLKITSSSKTANSFFTRFMKDQIIDIY